MDFFKTTLDLLKRDDNKLFKNTTSPASHKSSPGVNSINNGEQQPSQVATTTNTPPSNGTTTPSSILATSNNGNNLNGLPNSSTTTNGLTKNQPSTTTTTNSLNPPSPITSPNTSEQELWKLLEKQRQRKYFSDCFTNKEIVRKRKPPVNGPPQGTFVPSNVSNPNMVPQNPQQIKPASSNPSMKRKIGGAGMINQPVNVNNGPNVKTQQPPKKIKTAD